MLLLLLWWQIAIFASKHFLYSRRLLCVCRVWLNEYICDGCCVVCVCVCLVLRPVLLGLLDYRKHIPRTTSGRTVCVCVLHMCFCVAFRSLLAVSRRELIDTRREYTTCAWRSRWEMYKTSWNAIYYEAVLLSINICTVAAIYNVRKYKLMCFICQKWLKLWCCWRQMVSRMRENRVRVTIISNEKSYVFYGTFRILNMLFIYLF